MRIPIIGLVSQKPFHQPAGVLSDEEPILCQRFFVQEWANSPKVLIAPEKPS